MKSVGRNSVVGTALALSILLGVAFLSMFTNEPNNAAAAAGSEKPLPMASGPQAAVSVGTDSLSLPRSLASSVGGSVEFFAKSATGAGVANVEVVAFEAQYAGKRQVPAGGVMLGVTGADGIAKIATDDLRVGHKAFFAKILWADFMVPFREVRPGGWLAELPDAAVIKFQIVDTAGEPIQGVELAASKGPIPARWRGEGPSIAVYRDGQVHGIATSTTDAEGSVLLKLTAGNYGVEVEHEAFVASVEIALASFTVPGGPYKIVLTPLVGLALDIPAEKLFCLSLSCKMKGTPHFRGLRRARERMQERCPLSNADTLFMARAQDPMLKATLTAFVEGLGWIDRDYELKSLSGSEWCQSFTVPQGLDRSLVCGSLSFKVIDASNRELFGVPLSAKGVNGSRSWRVGKLQSGTDVRVPPGTYDITWGVGEYIEKIIVEAGGSGSGEARLPHDARLCEIELVGNLMSDVVGGIFLEAYVADQRVARLGFDGSTADARMLLPCGAIEFRASSQFLGSYSQFVDVPIRGAGEATFKAVLGR